ncbi:hypothetical protein IJI31_01710 [bacterium]|nr:hypothetical protein [bacterium]
MDFKALLQNKIMLISIGAGLLLVLMLGVSISMIAKGSSAPGTATEKPISQRIDLLTTDNFGKALEIQALLARERIQVERQDDGQKHTIYIKPNTCTPTQKDQAFLAIVKSGLMDQNIGLEIFDKGDFTSTKEDKRIRLARAINGELARLIRKIPPIENASVFISIPEQTMFSSMQKPVTATVQVTMPSGEKLDAIKIKAIKNLLLGSVTGLVSENISITDTNGNVYNSMINAESEMLARIEENDKYMQKKVMAQLDKLVGTGNYVATVSTFLKQAPVERFTLEYDPNRKASVTEQSFTEGLGDQTTDNNKNTNAVSVYLPNGLPAGGSDSSQNRSYSRSAKETQFGVTKIQTNEYLSAGVLEEISIALTLEKSAMPPDVTIEELKELVAKAASPKVNPENVSIAFTDSLNPYLASDRPVNLPTPDETGNPWWIVIAIAIIGSIIVYRVVSNKLLTERIESEKAINALKAKNMEQDKQLRDVSLKAAELIEKQSQLSQGLIAQQQKTFATDKFDDAVDDIKSEFDIIDEVELADNIKSWIEQG